MVTDKSMRFEQLLKAVEKISTLHDLDAVLNQTLLQTRSLCSADAGSIYLIENNLLKFSYFQNDTLEKSDKHSTRLNYTKLEIEISNTSIAGACALHGSAINIPDVYKLSDDLPYSFNNEYDRILKYRTTSVLTIPLITGQQKTIGVMQLINSLDSNGRIQPFSEDDAKTAAFFAIHAAGSVEKARLTREIILRMIRMAELRDPKETGAHVNRVGAYSVEIYRHWALHNGIHETEMQKFIDSLRIAAMLHDVGKVGISDLILKKPAKLDPEEFKIMQTHATVGALLFGDKTSELDNLSAEIALNHHEKFDGSGYPAGLSGAAIPIAARIVAISDVYDALICRRVYKEPWTEEDVLKEIKEQAGRHFDPCLVEIFLEIYTTIKAVHNKYPDSY